MSGQLELAELDSSRARLTEAEVRALRAQISPHFIYNALTAIASFVRTDPERARELLLEFADFTRYSFRRHGEFTTLAEELRSIEPLPRLEQARFGDRLQVPLQIAPEVLPVGGAVPVPAAAGRERRPARARGQAAARDASRSSPRTPAPSASITVEDDGVGEDPERVRRRPGRRRGDSDSVGLGNVDERLRHASATGTASWSRPRPAPAPR